MKNLLSTAIVLACTVSSCSLIKTATKVLGPEIFGVAPATADVPADFPAVRRIAVDMSTQQRARVEAAARQDILEHASLSVESQIRRTLTNRGFQVMDRDEMERMHEEAGFLPNDSNHSTQDDFYDSLDVEAVLFWDTAHSAPAIRRSADGVVSSTSDARVDLVLKSTGKIRGEAVASAEGTASWMGKDMNTAEIIDVMGTCASSAAAALGDALQNRESGE